MVVIAYSVVISMVLALFWPVVQTGINNFGIWIANSSETSPVLAPFIYGTLERLLLPFGLHHMLTIPMNYTSFGGTYTIATGDKVSMLRANFPGESLQAVAKHLADQHNPVAYVKSLDFAPEYVSCEYHTAYSNPDFIPKLQAMGIKVALWTVDTEKAVRSLLPLGPDCLVTNRPDRVREWVEENQ